MSTEKQVRLPNTDEVNALGSAQRGVEHLAGTILLDRYRLMQLLGTGGAAVVYRAEHTIMQKPVAVKILRPELAMRQDFIQRFLVEARTVARLRHENIVDIADVGRTETGLAFCVMEYLEGEELGATLAREGRLPWARARDIVLQVCQALAAAHAAGVVHRDVKPQNCFRIRHGNNKDFIKLLDFGIAKLTDHDQGLTETGMIMGTAEYMSPEQARGRNVDARTDIYAVGAMLFELLAGRAPFEGETFLDILMKHASEPVPRISSLVDGLDPQVETIINRALAKKPDDRFQAITHMIAALATVDGDTFRGLLDTGMLRQIDSRPESVLTRSSSHRQVPSPAPRSAALAIGISVIGGLALLGLWRLATTREQTAPTTEPAAVASVEPQALAPEPIVDPSPPSQSAAGEKPEPPAPLTTPTPAEPVLPQNATLVPQLIQPDPPRNASPTSPSPVPGTDGKTTPRSSPKRPSSATKASSKRASEDLLKKRIMAKCGKDYVLTAQSVAILVTATGLDVTQCGYRPLRKCIAEQVSASGLLPGPHSIALKPKLVTPDPLEDDG